MANKVRLYGVRTINGHGESEPVMYPAPSKMSLVNALTTQDVRVDVEFTCWGKVVAIPSNYDVPKFQITYGSEILEVESDGFGYGYLKQQCPKTFKVVEDYINGNEDQN
ncbi:hypothetical protein ACO0LG_10990 [Undibacterium sp. Ji42W]|uniref:hypothetical protein n=1 Tax=Undibacterium sp. Ji42W TaxID=3413039 RepID=UPI003BEFC078